jgi:FkbM family methyltransferase
MPQPVDAILCSNGWGSYCVPRSSRHRPAARAIIAGHVWEPETIRFMLQNCRNKDIVHAGAYFGDFLPALSTCGCDMAVWAFEPNVENYTCAEWTIQLNGLRNVHLVNAALGAGPSTVSLRTHDARGQSLGGASFVTGGQLSRSRQLTKVVTVDDQVDPGRSVGIIQLDVEGSENAALQGARHTIQRCTPKIILERDPDGEVLRWLKQLGYRRRLAVHNNLVWSPQD